MAFEKRSGTPDWKEGKEKGRLKARSRGGWHRHTQARLRNRQNQTDRAEVIRPVARGPVQVNHLPSEIDRSRRGGIIGNWDERRRFEDRTANSQQQDG
jgi:hypothetical protein